MGHIQSKVPVTSVQCLQRPEEGLRAPWPGATVVSWVLGIELGTVGEQLVLLTAQSCLQLQILFLIMCICVSNYGLVLTSAMPMEVRRGYPFPGTGDLS